MRLEPEWKGRTVFIVAGGASVLSQNLELMRGHKVIVINSSFETVPWADALFFGDLNWWTRNKAKLLGAFKGQIISVYEKREQPFGPGVIQLKKRKPPGLAVQPDELTMRRTSLTGAINLAFHLGGNPIVILGADGRMSGDRSHHHAPHQGWVFKPERWPSHRAELLTLVDPLRSRGIEVINASPGTAWHDIWPVMTLEQAIHHTECRRAA